MKKYIVHVHYESKSDISRNQDWVQGKGTELLSTIAESKSFNLTEWITHNSYRISNGGYSRKHFADKALKDELDFAESHNSPYYEISGEVIEVNI